MKKVLIIKAHPREESFCNQLVQKYLDGANNNEIEVRILNLHDLNLEPWLKYTWDTNHDSMPDSEDLKKSKELILWSDHLLFAYPTYWASPPALLKLFLEVIITSHFAFKYHKPYFGKIPNIEKLLVGRTASLLSTMDAPPILMKLIDKDPGGRMMKDILRFTGIKFKYKFYFGPVFSLDAEERVKWLKKAEEDGEKDTI